MFSWPSDLKLGEGEKIEEDEDEKVDEEGLPPAGEHGYRDILDGPGGGQAAEVDGNEAGPADEAGHLLLGLHTVPGNEDLGLMN